MENKDEKPPEVQTGAVPSTSDQTKELLQFLRQENEANRAAIRTDADANRKLLLDTVKLVSIPVTALILVAGWFGFRSISDLKETLESDARGSTQAEIARMQQSTQAEITRMQGEIRSRLNEQFQTPTLRKLVEDAAKESTKTAAEPLIRTEVASQVKLRVDAEKPTIATAVTQQTQTAVKQMGSQIDSLVKSALDAKLATDVDPVIQRVKDEADLQLLITRMNADDAVAFDVLTHANFSDPSQRTAVFAAAQSVINAHNAGFFQMRTFGTPQSDDQLVAHLSDSDSGSRQAALAALTPKRNLTLLPRVVEMMRSDPSIDTRCAAYRLFNSWTTQSYQGLNVEALVWWQNNKQKMLPAQ